ncbi:MAG: aldolase catalytic domain-containing protein [Phycisphaerae bacterium]|jgi:4-hydroxy 2-oxovalerate aldolase
MFREKIKVLDCTIRDGGLINNHYFTDEFVRAVYKSLSEAGIDYMEMGYRASRMLSPEANYGPWKYCDDDKISRIIDGIESNTKISIMVDAHRVKEQQFKPADQSPVDMIRVATYVKDIDKAIAMLNIAHDLGYETTVNIMAASIEVEKDLIEALDQLAATPAEVVYIVDSYGYFYCEQIEYMANLYRQHLPGKELGIHCHNNQQLAFANTVEAIIQNVNYVDASLYGIGRGAGNCPLELVMGFLKNPKFSLTPILKVIEDYMIPMLKEMEWGYLIPYMVTGILNRHPEAAISYRKTPDKDKYAEFYEKIRDSLDSL